MADTTEIGSGALEHTATDVAHGAESAGMPQLDFSTFPNQIFWLTVALVALYLILSKVALPQIAGILSERQGTITNDLATAEELKLKAREAEAAYEKALADARAEAGRISGEARAAMQEDLNAAIAKSDKEIDKKTAESEKRIAEIREGAMKSVEEVARDTAAALVTALGASADDSQVRAAVDAEMKG